MGISRHVIREFVEDWIVRIEDYTPRVAKMHALLKAGKADEAKRHLPVERLYPLPAPIARNLLIKA